MKLVAITVLLYQPLHFNLFNTLVEQHLLVLDDLQAILPANKHILTAKHSTETRPAQQTPYPIPASNHIPNTQIQPYITFQISTLPIIDNLQLKRVYYTIVAQQREVFNVARVPYIVGQLLVQAVFKLFIAYIDTVVYRRSKQIVYISFC